MDPIPRAELDTFRSIVAARLGLHFDETKMDLLADVFRQRLEARGRISTGSYLAGFAYGVKGREELRTLASLLTVAETYFFRSPEHFRVLADLVSPERMSRRNAH